MENYGFDCSKMTDTAIQEHIKMYTDCGWTFNGFMNFPPPHIMACFTWDKDCKAIHPQKKSKC